MAVSYDRLWKLLIDKFTPQDQAKIDRLNKK